MTLAEAGLAGANDFPFKSGVVESDNKYSGLVKNSLKPVKAVTVNTSTGSDATRRRLVKKYNPDIETMEGATFFYICARNFIPFLALRAISNYVEPRNKNNWNIPLALENLAEKCNEFIIRLE
jgi:futalosine hydrolase